MSNLESQHYHRVLVHMLECIPAADSRQIARGTCDCSPAGEAIVLLTRFQTPSPADKAKCTDPLAGS